MIKRVDKGKPALVITCPNCDVEYESPYAPGRVIKFQEMFDEYENISVGPCPNCNQSIAYNLNLPEDELSETFFEEKEVPTADRIHRRNISELKNEFVFEGREG